MLKCMHLNGTCVSHKCDTHSKKKAWHQPCVYMHTCKVQHICSYIMYMQHAHTYVHVVFVTEQPSLQPVVP